MLNFTLRMNTNFMGHNSKHSPTFTPNRVKWPDRHCLF